MTSRSATEVICDAGPLIHLDELGCLDLLTDFPVVLVPNQVWREVEVHRPQALQCAGLEMERVPVSISRDAPFIALVRALALDLGEQAALSLTAHHPDSILLTDDAAARLAARGLSYRAHGTIGILVRAHGTIGILVRAIRRRLRTADEVILILRELPDRSSLHIRPQLLEEIIAELLDARSHGGGW